MSQVLTTIDADVEDLIVNVEDIITEDDMPMDNLFSEKQQRLLTEPLYSSWTVPAVDTQTEPRKFLAAANVGMFPSLYKPPLVPDMFLSLDVAVHQDWYEKRHRSYFFWEFGKPPEAVIEIVSNRKGNEAGSKLYDYARCGVIYYVIYDPTRQLSDEELRVFENHAGSFKRRADDFLPEVGLGLTLWEGTYEGQNSSWLRWCDAQGQVVLTGAEALLREAARTRHEAERATREAERAERLAAKLRALGEDPDLI